MHNFKNTQKRFILKHNVIIKDNFLIYYPFRYIICFILKHILNLLYSYYHYSGNYKLSSFYDSLIFN